MPTTVTPGGTSRVTTAPAPTIAPAPIEMRGNTTAPIPINAPGANRDLAADVHTGSDMRVIADDGVVVDRGRGIENDPAPKAASRDDGRSRARTLPSPGWTSSLTMADGWRAVTKQLAGSRRART